MVWLLLAGRADLPAFYLVVADGRDASVEEGATPGPPSLDPEEGPHRSGDEDDSGDHRGEDDDEGRVHCDMYAGHLGWCMSNINLGLSGASRLAGVVKNGPAVVECETMDEVEG